MEKIGKYEILDKIGAGGFSVVYKGYDPFIKRSIAVKVCFSRDHEVRQRFFREAEIAGRMVHRNIISVYDFGVHNEMPYLVEEYLPGEDLAHLIRRGEPRTLETKLSFLLQIASGLEYAHAQGVIHRDIKPSNVRVLDDGTLKIMDFGTAKLADVDSQLTQAGMTLGTVAYLSPERLIGKLSGLNSDIFSYGVLAYELLAFRRPFSGRTIPSLIDQVLNSPPTPLVETWRECPENLARVVHRCLEKDPEVRYASCNEVIADLEEFRDRQNIVFSPEVGGRNSDSTTVVLPLDMQLSGLLQRAHQLVKRGKHERATLLLEEVLEIDPHHAEAQRLLSSSSSKAIPAPELSEGAPALDDLTPVELQPTVAAQDPEKNRRRKIAEAVQSIERDIRNHELARAADAMGFAFRIFGPFDQLRALRRDLVAALDASATKIREEAKLQAHKIVAAINDLKNKNALPLQLAEHLVESVQDLEPGHPEAERLLSDLRQLERQREAPNLSEHRSRKQAEAVVSIEKLLAANNPDMAERALQFAVQLLGDFPEIRDLEKRIHAARHERD